LDVCTDAITTVVLLLELQALLLKQLCKSSFFGLQLLQLRGPLLDLL
jgi:hypothetical protein